MLLKGLAHILRVKYGVDESMLVKFLKEKRNQYYNKEWTPLSERPAFEFSSATCFVSDHLRALPLSYHWFAGTEGNREDINNNSIYRVRN